MDSFDSFLETSSSDDLDEDHQRPVYSTSKAAGTTALRHGLAEREIDYQVHLADLRQQLVLLEDKVHPIYTRRLEKIEAALDERLSLNACVRDFETDLALGAFRVETEAADRDFDHQERVLRQKLVADLEKSLEFNAADRLGLRLTDPDDGEERCVPTRNLRRKIHDPSGHSGEKRPKPNRFSFSLDEVEINKDLKAIYKPAPSPIRVVTSIALQNLIQSSGDIISQPARDDSIAAAVAHDLIQVNRDDLIAGYIALLQSRVDPRIACGGFFTKLVQDYNLSREWLRSRKDEKTKIAMIKSLRKDMQIWNAIHSAMVMEFPKEVDYLINAVNIGHVEIPNPPSKSKV